MGPDCDDTEARRFPGNAEGCDGLDNDCDGVADEANVCAPCTVLYRNSDGLQPYQFCQFATYTWAQARTDCLSTNGGNTTYDLVIMETLAEAQWVDAVTNNVEWWIGLNDVQQEGQFRWVDGSPLTYNYFQSGEPNNSGNEDCVLLRDVGWNDQSCGSERRWICEAQ
jgi:hypothetical protein